MESFDFNQYKLERNLDIKNTTFLYKNVTDSKSIVLKKYSNGDIEDAKEMMDINHPSISKILSVLPSKDNHSFELTTYYYPNGSLETLINRIENKDTPSWYDPTIISKIILGTIVGLEELHSQGFTHGNLKPSNILIDSNYNPQLTDISFNSITANSQYCAPEIFSKTNNYDKSIDVYSFGMILCFIYVQESPFDESLPLNDLGDFVIDGERPVLPDTIPKNIQDIIEKCWSTSQKDRPTIKYLANIFTTDEYLYPGTKKNLFNFYKDNILHFNPKDFVIEEKKTKEIQEDDKYNEVEPYEIYEEIDKILENNKGMKKLSGLYDDIFSLSSNSIDDSIDELTKIYDENNSHLFDVLICRLLFFSYISQKNDADTVIEFLQKISEHYPKVIELFIQYMNNVLEYTQESRFLLLKMVEHGLIKFEYVAHANESFYFLHYLNESISRSLYYSTKNFEISYEDLRKNNWELHKKFISEGINQDQLPKILRNDNIEEFQQISSSPYFDFNQIIHASPYEQHTYINCDVNLLGYCAFFGSLNCFKFLLLNNTYKQSVDLYAVAGGNIEIIYLCEKNDIYFSPKALEAAIEYHHNDIFIYLIEANKMYYHTEKINEFLYQCITYHNFDLFIYIIKFQTRIVSSNVLVNAVRKGNIYIIGFLLDLEKSKIIPKIKKNSDSLAIACNKGYIDIVKLLLEFYNSGINEVCKNNKTPICYALKRNQIDIALVLINHSNFKPIGMIKGLNIFEYSIIQNQTKVTIALKNRFKFDLNKIITKDNLTILYVACKNNEIKAVESILKEKNIYVNEFSNDETPLTVACTNGFIEIVKLLCAYPSINVNVYKLKSPLYIACEKGFTEIVKILLQNKNVDVNTKVEPKIKEKDYPLHIACEKGYPEIVELLLTNKNIELNITNHKIRKYKKVQYEYNKTPLFIACEKGFVDIVKLLTISPKIDINCESLSIVDDCMSNNPEQYMTPLYIACKNEFVDIVKILLENKEIEILGFENSPLNAARKTKNSEIINLLNNFLRENPSKNSVKQ